MLDRKILVTSALPYANGPIHLGHLVEYIQTDIWVRFQKQRGNACYFVCADDTHGTPIMLKADREGITPEQLIAQVGKEHLADFTEFGVWLLIIITAPIPKKIAAIHRSSISVYGMQVILVHVPLLKRLIPLRTCSYLTVL